MEFVKFRQRNDEEIEILPTCTVPDQSFTPRQIIEQFASGEIVVQEHTPTDDFYDDKLTDEQLENIVEVNDDFIARQFVLDFQVNTENDSQASNQVRAGSPSGAAKANDGVSGSSNLEGSQQSPSEVPTS